MIQIYQMSIILLSTKRFNFETETIPLEPYYTNPEKFDRTSSKTNVSNKNYLILIKISSYLCSCRWHSPSARVWSWLRCTSLRARTFRRTGGRPAGRACTWSSGCQRNRRDPFSGFRTGRNRRRLRLGCCWPRRRPPQPTPSAGQSDRTSWAWARTSCWWPTADSGSRWSRSANGSVSRPPCRTSGSRAVQRPPPPTVVRGVAPPTCTRRRPPADPPRPTAGTRCCGMAGARRRAYRTETMVPQNTPRRPCWWCRRTTRQPSRRRVRSPTLRLREINLY